MAIKLTAITHQLRNSFIELQTDEGAEKIEFSYRGYTPAVSQAAEEATERATKQGEATTLSIETLVRVLVSWGILDDEDKPLPITRENLSLVHYRILNEMVAAILEDANPKKKS